MRVFIDTSAFFALLDADDANHKEAKESWSNVLIPENVLVTTNYVLVETFALVQHRLGMDAVRAFDMDVAPLLNIEWVTPAMHRSGISALLAASRRRLSLVDCISFEVMRNLGIENAFVFDPHFEEHGFRSIP
ncbi:MAG TPA: PIN domain-containing protein [Dissulfurispiraceae bacterium]|nr:PIN domain-containing protein [Dissulfurispiraceae bacterium]